MNILQIQYSKLEGISKELLDGITSQSNNVGKKENNYWIIKSDTAVTGFPQEKLQEVQLLNMLLNFAHGQQYSNVMIIDD